VRPQKGTRRVSHKKPQKAQKATKGTKTISEIGYLFCDLCAFLWLTLLVPFVAPNSFW
jgi:hypothetical protein